MKTQKITTASFYLSLSIILTRFFAPYIFLFGSRTLRLDLGWVVIAFAGLTLGPLMGMIIGGLSDFIGANMFPVDSYYFGFTISAMLTGLIPGLLKIFFSNKKLLMQHKMKILGGFFAIILVAVGIILLLNVNVVLFSKPKIVLTPTLLILFYLALIAYFIALFLIVYFLERKRQDGNYVLATITIVTIVALIQVPLTPLWLHNFLKLNYRLLLLARVFILLPYIIIPIIVLRALLGAKIEKTWE